MKEGSTLSTGSPMSSQNEDAESRPLVKVSSKRFWPLGWKYTSVPLPAYVALRRKMLEGADELDHIRVLSSVLLRHPCAEGGVRFP